MRAVPLRLPSPFLYLSGDRVMLIVLEGLGLVTFVLSASLRKFILFSLYLSVFSDL